MADYIYIGPTLSRYGLKNFETYRDRPSGNILELMNKYPAVASLVVPQAELVSKQKEVNKKGTALYAAYQSVSDESAFGSNVGNGPIITPTEPIPPYKNSYFNTPVPNKQYNSAGEIVNPADFYGSNGFKVDMSGGSVEAQENFTFANAVTTAGSKTFSSSKKKDVVITFFGTGTAIFTAKLISNGIKLPVQGFRETGKYALLDSFAVNEIITFEKPPGSDLELSWTLPTGGNVSAKAVISNA